MDPNMSLALEALGAVRGLEIVLRVLTGSTKWAKKTFLEHFERPGERRELIHQLFMDRGDFLFHPGTDWRPAAGQCQAPYLGRGYPHELRALRSFVPFLPEKAAYQETLFFPADLAVSSRLVCTGSPKANAFVRRYLPSISLSADGARQQYETVLRPEALRYVFGEDLAAPRVKAVSMMEPGKVAEKTRKLIWTWKGEEDLSEWRPKGHLEGAELRRDFLLVSRLPRTRAGGDVLIFAGAHGAGTEATSLLLRKLHIRQLRDLVDTLQGAAYWQFVVEVTRLRHSQTGTVPTRIQISDALPPVSLNIGAVQLRPQAAGRRRVWR